MIIKDNQREDFGVTLVYSDTHFYRDNVLMTMRKAVVLIFILEKLLSTSADCTGQNLSDADHKIL